LACYRVGFREKGVEKPSVRLCGAVSETEFSVTLAVIWGTTTFVLYDFNHELLYKIGRATSREHLEEVVFEGGVYSSGITYVIWGKLEPGYSIHEKTIEH
jgi:hypothetical protein